MISGQQTFPLWQELSENSLSVLQFGKTTLITRKTINCLHVYSPWTKTFLPPNFLVTFPTRILILYEQKWSGFSLHYFDKTERSLAFHLRGHAPRYNPFPSKWVLRALIDFTLSNARRFYSSMGNLLDRKGISKPYSIICSTMIVSVFRVTWSHKWRFHCFKS